MQEDLWKQIFPVGTEVRFCFFILFFALLVELIMLLIVLFFFWFTVGSTGQGLRI